jgi:PAS domain S-box-containing protein
MSAPLQSTSALGQIEQLGEALREHFQRSPVGMLLMGDDRRILAANDSVSRITGISAAILPGSSLRRFLSSDAPSDLEERVFAELAREGRWLGEVDFRSSVGDTSPVMLSITPVAARLATSGPAQAVGYVCTIVELGQLRWIEAESFRRAQELAAFSAIAVASGSSSDPQEMLAAVTRQVVEGLGMDACWIHRFDAQGARLSLAGEASYLNPSLQLSPRMIPDPVNPAVLRAMQSRELVAESELLDRGIATVVHIPLLARGEVVGVISILGIAGEKLTGRDSDLLRTVSYQIGTAVQNARLVESVREHEAELQEKNEQLEQLVERLRPPQERIPREHLP